MECHMLDDFNNLTSSISVGRTAALGTAKGRWVSMTGSTKLDYELSEGFTSSHTENTEEVNQYTLSYEMNMNISLDVFGVSESISEGYAQTISYDIEDSYSASLSDKISFSCPEDPDDPSAGVGLWQWIVESSDRKTKTYSKHWVCRTGEGRYNKAPECPWNACIDGNCYECESGWAA